MALVRLENARRSSSGSKRQSGGCSRTNLRAALAKQGVGAVVFVVGFEDHNLVARIGNGEQRRDHALGGAAANCDFPLGIDLQAVMAAILGGDGVAERLGAPGDGVLINVGRNRVRQPPV